MATGHHGPMVNNMSPAVSSFLLERFPQIYSTHRQLLATMFGATYKNLHLTGYVYQICDALHQGKPPCKFSDIFTQNMFHRKTSGNFGYFEQFPQNVAQND
jgi:hypothetical protein